jgi:hypothetical protein
MFFSYSERHYDRKVITVSVAFFKGPLFSVSLNTILIKMSILKTY